MPSDYKLVRDFIDWYLGEHLSQLQYRYYLKGFIFFNNGACFKVDSQQNKKEDLSGDDNKSL